MRPISHAISAAAIKYFICVIPFQVIGKSSKYEVSAFTIFRQNHRVFWQLDFGDYLAVAFSLFDCAANPDYCSSGKFVELACQTSGNAKVVTELPLLVTNHITGSGAAVEAESRDRSVRWADKLCQLHASTSTTL